MTFPEKLKELREEKGYSQKALADVLNLSCTAVSHYETGSREPGIDVLIQIAKFLDVSVDYLIGYSNVNITPSQLQKQYCKGVDNGKLLERLLQLDSAHRQILLSIIKCIESDYFVSENSKRR